ncbi:MAG: hypothetical protein AAFV72_24000 [Cyanobacteria bacterium J06635_1]
MKRKYFSVDIQATILLSAFELISVIYLYWLLSVLEMPYIHEYERHPDVGYQYHSARGEFSVRTLSRYSLEAFEILQQLNVRRMRCSYNGGGDEGFAHFEEAILEEGLLNVNVLKQQLSEGPLSRQQNEQDNIPYTLVTWAYNELTPEERVRERLDALAQEFAVCLLGDYGTGELSIYGSFCVEFKTGEIIDEQQEQTS